ncbi:MAG: 3'-5' exonuclease [Bacteroidales bacterium]|nr:3'-5' exonuclease [Bacteroidales bacterium]
MENSLLSKLNPDQRAAAECTEGPEMIIAGAGSGKTRTLTYRIAYLIQQGIDPFNILALTFTNKAAGEMKERIMQLVGPSARNIWMGTFHSIFARILRNEADKLGYVRTFTIYDTDDSKSALRQIVKQLNLDPKTYSPNSLIARISMAKSNLISPEEYASNAEILQSDQTSKRPATREIYRLYNQRLRNAQAMDFDDLLFNTNVLMRDFPNVLMRYQERFRYIHVDEYQDTNYAQYLIIKKLSARYQNICVVGDDAQSIYAFRGANIQNIFNFRRDYPNVQLFKLEQNYRSTQNIVHAANSIISNNKEQIKKEIWTNNEQGIPITLVSCSDEKDEGKEVAKRIQSAQQEDGWKYSDFAVLYRNNVQSRAVEEALRHLQIPYRIYAGISFYGRKIIKDVLAYLRLVVNNHDDESMLRSINNPPRGIGQTTLDKIRVAANDNEVSLCTVMEDIDTFGIALNAGVRQKIDHFLGQIKVFSSMLYTMDAYNLAKKVIYASGIIKALKEDDDPENPNMLENIEELLNGIQDFCQSDDLIAPEEDHEVDATTLQSNDNWINVQAEIASLLSPEREEEEEQANRPLRTLDQFLQQVLLLTSEDKDKEKNADKVSLMTIHAAKGLEFPYVFIVGMEENLFPSIMSLSSRQELEEERRLFYVAVTRAEKRLVLSHALTRYQYGQQSGQEMSRFVDEIDPQYISMPKTKSAFPKPGEIFSHFAQKPAEKPRPKKLIALTNNATKPTLANSSAQISSIQPGMQVSHSKFGTGKVLSLEGSGDSTKAVVFFEGIGQKTLVLKYAKLDVVS